MGDDSAIARHHIVGSVSRSDSLSSSLREHAENGRPDRDFPRASRLLNGRSYDTVFGDNRRLGDRYWTVLVHAPSDDSVPGTARLGLAIAKKRARRAVDRNRIKRVARESFRHARAMLGRRHIVVMNRDAATTASAADLRQALDAIWSRVLKQSPVRDRVKEEHGARRRSSSLRSAR